MNTGDTAFVLVSSALVMLMTPGLALFYGGMVRGKNVLRTILWGFCKEEGTGKGEETKARYLIMT